jgi:DNA-binding transcriptional MerR regulator
MDKSPDAFRTIAEVSEDLDLPQHVLRFWETRFIQIKPMKRGGGRRYYRPVDVELLKGIRHLLYDQGYTIKGVQRLLKDNGAQYVVTFSSGDQKAADIISQQYKNTRADFKPTREPVTPEIGTIKDNITSDIIDENIIVGTAQISAPHRFFGLKNKAEEKTQTANDKLSLSKDNRDLLQEVLFDLLECKRLLDQIRI